LILVASGQDDVIGAHCGDGDDRSILETDAATDVGKKKKESRSIL